MVTLLLMILALASPVCEPVAEWDSWDGMVQGENVVFAMPVMDPSETNVHEVVWRSTIPICQVDVYSSTLVFVNGYYHPHAKVYEGTASGPNDWWSPLKKVVWYSEYTHNVYAPIVTRR